MVVPILTGTTPSCPKVKANRVSPVVVLWVVLYGHNTLDSSSIHALFFCSKPDFQKPLDYLVGCFYLSVRLRMSRRTILQLYPEVLKKIPEVVVIKLPAIICYQGIWDLVTTYPISPYEVSCLFFYDPAEGFYFYPLREIVYCYYCMCCCSSSLWQRPDQINSPLSKWSMGGHRGKLLWWLVRKICKTLAAYTAPDLLLRILVHCRPEIFLP